jgi:rod shape-determining protein MreD
VNIARIIFVALVVFIIQVTAISRIAVAGCTPDLIVILLVSLVLERGPVMAVVIGFLLGFLQDLGNASFLGMNALSKSILAYGVSRLGGGLLPENVLYKGFIVFAACLLNDIVVLPITTSFAIGEIFVSFFRYSLFSALYSALVGVCIFALLELLTRRVVRPGGGH